MEDKKEAIEPIVEEVIESTESWKSDKIDKLATALAKVQGELDGAKSESTNPFFKSSYADLHTVIKSSFPFLSKHGLCVSHGNEVIPGAICVTTTLIHESGQWLRSKIKLPLQYLRECSISISSNNGDENDMLPALGSAILKE